MRVIHGGEARQAITEPDGEGMGRRRPVRDQPRRLIDDERGQVAPRQYLKRPLAASAGIEFVAVEERERHACMSDVIEQLVELCRV